MKSAVWAALGLLLSVATAGSLADESVTVSVTGVQSSASAPPLALSMKRAAGPAANLNLRAISSQTPRYQYRDRPADPSSQPAPFPAAARQDPNAGASSLNAPALVPAGDPAPSPTASFEGLDFSSWGAGHPSDDNGDVGPVYYVQVINGAIGIFRKSDGVRVAATTFNDLMSQGNFGNLCDNANFGDPVVLYDSFEDRWILTDFAFQRDGANNILNPPGSFQCFAVSKSDDPVTGGWNYYSIQITDGMNDYSKFGIWPDGLYMSSNMFGFAAGAPYQNPRVWAFNKMQMYAGEPTVQIVQFDAPSAEFSLLPSNARLQAGSPPAGTPNYFAVVWQFLNAVSYYKFHVDWNRISLSSFTGPFLTLTATNWSQLSGASQSVQSPVNKLDTLYPRLMMQNQYSHVGGVESLWQTHTVGASGSSSTQAAVRYYQTDVTGGNVAANATQAYTYSPDATVHRFMPSLAVNRLGDMAIGYSATSSTLNPAIRYAGRLAGDPANAITQTETSMIEGTGTQSGTCGGTSCTRWGDYSAMTLDPDGCTFWYTNQYYQVSGLNFNTRIASFSFPGCVPVSNGVLQGTVTASLGGAPISGATISLGSRTTTTDASGFYSFAAVPPGTYPNVASSFPGYLSAYASNLVVSDGSATTQDFSLGAAPASACFTDTSQADFQAGVGTNADLTTNAGDVSLSSQVSIDQQNTTLGTSGVGITTTTWGGQTFTPALSGPMPQVDINLFCSGCTGSVPNLTLSLRATSGGLPTGADIATATISGFNGASSAYYTAIFASPPVLTAGTEYALLIRPTANPSPGTYALTRSGTAGAGSNVYAAGARITGATSGTVWSVPLTGGVSTDAGFKVYIDTGFPSSGTLDSSLKDANPSAGYTPVWNALNWTDSLPTNTDAQFQVAASDAAIGPFNFVGPDGTAASYFTSTGASLSQFNGKRYLKYRAVLSSSVNTATPTLNDVTACVQNLPALTIDDVSLNEGSAGTTTFTFTVSLSAPAGTGGVSFDIATADGTASAPSDYTAKVLTNQLIPEGSTSYTFDVAVNGDYASEANETFFVNVTNIVNAAVATSQGKGTILNDDAEADLSVSKIDTPDPVTAGSTLSYAIAVSNAGPGAAAVVSMSDTLPSGTTFVSLSSPGGWSCTTPAVGASGTVSCSIATLAVSDSAPFSLVVAVAPGVSAGTVISNTASVSGATTDSNPANDSATATTTVGVAADLGVTMSDAPDPVNAGSNISYTITLNNAGPSYAASVSLTDALPAGTTFVSLSSPGGWSCTTPAVGGSGTVSCSVATLAPGSGVFTLVVNVGAGLTAGTVLTNTATASSASNDPNPGNDSGSTSTTLAGAPSVTGIMSVSGNFVAGGTVTYVVVLTNGGTTTQLDNPGPEFTDVLPAALQLLGATASAGSVTATPDGKAVRNGNLATVAKADAGIAAILSGSNTVNWDGSIAPGASVTITITATIRPDAVAGASVANQGTIATDLDGNGSNETNRVTDNPATGGAGDPTSFAVAVNAEIMPVPLFGDVGKVLSILLILLVAGWLMRGKSRQR